MKKVLGALLACVLFVLPIACLGEEETEEVFATSAKASILIDAKSGRILYESNAHQPLPMASTTKVMTALMAMEYGKMDERVTASKNAYGVPGTSIYLDLGESLTLNDMLYGLMLASGNDAAVAIAEHIGGTVDNFCKRMTERAKELGCENTVFKTPNGLPNAEHFTTAYDLALIAREAMTYPLFRQIVSTTRATIPWEGRTYERVLNNKNRLLTDYQGANGIKTGYTKAAGRCLVFGAEREGLMVIGVVLNCGDWFNEAMRIMDDGFNRYTFVTALDEGAFIRQLPVTDAESEVLDTILAKPLQGTMLKGVAPEIEIELPESISGGAEQGETLGTARLYENGTLIDEADIIAKEQVRARTFRTNFTRTIRQWFSEE